MKNKNHVITSHNVEQEVQKLVRSDVVIPNKLGNGETCQGLRHWRLLSNLKNNFSKLVRNDMGRHPEGDSPKDLSTNTNLKTSPEFVSDKNKLDCFAFARNDEKTVTNLFPYFPISLSLKKKIDSSPNALALNGYGFALMLKLVRLRMTAFTLAEGATHVDLSPTKVKFAFTLAEVLITLGIIGVVAALTIPSLITKYHRHVVETKLVKFDSIINQAVRMSIAENDDLVFNSPEDVVDKGPYLKEWFDENLMKYIKGDYDGGVIRNRYYKIIFHDGTGFVAYIPDAGSNIYFFYCLEAKDKSCKPESFDGKNTFLYTYEPSQKAVLPGSYYVTDVNKLKYGFGQDKSYAGGCYQTNRTDRHMCTQLIKQNGWKIPDDYPWIK